MSEEDRLDIITVSDEDGKELLFKVEQYFYYNGQEYVHLRLMDDQGSPHEGSDNDQVMLVETELDEEGEEIEDFVPIEPALMDSLLQAIRARHTVSPDEQE